MPTYEYECSKCNKTFEMVQSMKDSAIKTCPQDKCPEETWGQGEVKRLIGTGAGLIFKGSGFYITDYRSDNYKAGAKKDTPSSSSPETPKKETPAPKPSESKPSTANGA